MTLRQARRKFGTRSTRRRNTNGKNIPGRPMGKGGRIAFKYANPRKVSRKVMLQVRALMRAQ